VTGLNKNSGLRRAAPAGGIRRRARRLCRRAAAVYNSSVSTERRCPASPALARRFGRAGATTNNKRSKSEETPMRRQLGFMVAAVAALCAAPVWAQSFNYDYVDLGYRTGEVFEDIDVSGFGAEASRVLAPNLRLKLGADWLDADDVDADGYRIALQGGFFTALAPNVDVVLDAGLLYMDIDDVDDDTGVKLDGIVRFRVDPRFEVNAGLSYVDIFDDSDTGLHLAGIYSLNRSTALLVRFDDNDAIELWTFGVRLSY